jgi:pantoate--beta-alanine ligase
MQVVKSVAGMRRLVKAWRAGAGAIGFVPTMGYLHVGHLSLFKRARQAVGSGGKVVVSIYVNPTQFGPGEDLSRYPRDLGRDVSLCRRAGVDAVFVPTDTEIYPSASSSDYSTYVVEEKLSAGMEGASRPTHFRGVTTVVAKLFNIVSPDAAVFGAKDWQQAMIIKRMVRDLNFPLKVIVAPTCREPDGLAMSSRNKYLEGDLRSQALCLWECICNTRAAVRNTKRGLSAKKLESELRRVIARRPEAKLDYIAFFEPETLELVSSVRRGVRIALAVFVGRTRLIDNAVL